MNVGKRILDVSGEQINARKNAVNDLDEMTKEHLRRMLQARRLLQNPGSLKGDTVWDIFRQFLNKTEKERLIHRMLISDEVTGNIVTDLQWDGMPEEKKLDRIEDHATKDPIGFLIVVLEILKKDQVHDLISEMLEYPTVANIMVELVITYIHQNDPELIDRRPRLPEKLWGRNENDLCNRNGCPGLIDWKISPVSSPIEPVHVLACDTCDARPELDDPYGGK